MLFKRPKASSCPTTTITARKIFPIYRSVKFFDNVIPNTCHIVAQVFVRNVIIPFSVYYTMLYCHISKIYPKNLSYVRCVFSIKLGLD